MSNKFPLCYADELPDMYEGLSEEPISIAYFSDKDFDSLFQKSNKDIHDFMESHKIDLDNFNFDEGLAKGPNNEEKVAFFWNTFSDPSSVTVFSFNESNRKYPDRWQDVEDLTEWLEEALG